jgi:hypothetical protein
MNVRDIYISITINGRKEGKVMVEPVEARGRKSLCTLVDLQDWDAAKNRYDELGVAIRYYKNKPCVNIDEVKTASKRWHGRKKSHSPP